MSVRPRVGVEVPEMTARVARASNPAGTTAMWVRDRLDGLWDDEDFAGWYPREGRPGISPAQLATVSVLQFLLGLSDRDAAEAVRCRIDFKYALGLHLDDPGFHHSVLGDFRERLLAEGRADRLLDLALARLKEAGLVRERTTQRTDSTRVLAAVRDLTRLELVTEAVRAALEELARTAGDALARPGGRGLGPPLRAAGPAGQEPHPAQDQDERRRGGRPPPAGAPGRAAIPGLLRGPRAQALRQILLQNYHWDPAGRLRWRDDEGDAGLPPSAARRSPARRARSARAGTAPTRPPRPMPPRSSSPASPRPSAALPGPCRLHHLRRRQAHRGLPRANCSNCRYATALTSRTPPGTSATPSDPASSAPSARLPTATACATAATAASPKPTSSTS